MIALFEKLFALQIAEKLLVCVAILLQATGYRYLVQALGKNAYLPAMLFLPLLIDFPLGAGFVNYCIASGIAYFAIAIWLRFHPGHVARQLAVFFSLLLLLLLTHPVPLLIVGGYIFGDLLLRFLSDRDSGMHAYWEDNKQRWIALALVALFVLISAAFAHRKHSGMGLAFHHVYVLDGLIHLNFLLLCKGTFLAAILYRVAVYASLLLALFFAGRRALRAFSSGSLDNTDRVFLISLVFVILIPFLPVRLGGGFYFAERMIDIAWPLLLAPLAAVQVTPRTRKILTVSCAFFIALSILVWARQLKPVAVQAVALGKIPVPASTQGIFLEPPQQLFAPNTGFSYPILAFAGLRSIVAHDAVLLNTPWLNQKIIPITARPGSDLLANHFTIESKIGEQPWTLFTAISNPQVRDLVLAKSQFLIFEDTIDPPDMVAKEFQTQLRPEDLQGWQCQTGPNYVYCHK